MHHHLFTLKSHPDITKFEFEDGLVRHAAASLLTAKSAIHDLLIDLPTERTFALGDEIDFPAWDGLLVVSSSEPGIVEPTQIADLVVDVASVVDDRPVLLVEHSDLDATWVGTATPASKISFVVQPGSGIDNASFAAWLRDMLNDVSEKFPGTGCRALGPIDDTDDVRDAIISFWFPDTAALNAAISGRFYDPIVEGILIEPDSVRARSTIEHRKSPNPNSWDMPTGRIMPIQDADSDS